MKTLLIILTCLALGNAQAQTNAEPRNLVLCGLVVGAAALAGAIVIYVHYKTEGCSCEPHHKLVLERDAFDGNWTPIQTNITQICTNKIQVFRDQMNDEGARYRVRDLGLVP